METPLLPICIECESYRPLVQLLVLTMFYIYFCFFWSEEITLLVLNQKLSCFCPPALKQHIDLQRDPRGCWRYTCFCQTCCPFGISVTSWLPLSLLIIISALWYRRQISVLHKTSKVFSVNGLDKKRHFSGLQTWLTVLLSIEALSYETLDCQL